MFKCCKSCGVEKPANTAFFRTSNAKLETLRRKCRACEGKQEGDYDRKGGCRPKLTEQEKRDRNRASCRERYQKNKDKYLARVMADRKANPEKHREWDRRSWEKNREQKRQSAKRYRATLDKKVQAEKLKKWKRDNPDKVNAMWLRKYAKHKDRILAYGKQWAKENPDARAAIANRRRARELGATGNYTKEDVRDLLRVYGRVCFYCSAALKKFHVDHFIPMARGGSNDPVNLRLSCPTCNYSKAARMPWEWMSERFSQPLCEAA